jgi:hypothetical protein
MVITVPDDELGSAADPLAAALLAVADHADLLGRLGGQLGDIGSRLQALERRRDEQPEASGYTPIPGPRWWMLPREDRLEAVQRLAAWVDQVYAPSYGHLARMLSSCWREHDLCLFILDFASELHSVLYLRPSRSARTLADQAEFSLRILPAAAELMRAETTRCDHPQGLARSSPLATRPMKGTWPAGANAHSAARPHPAPGGRS